MKKPSLSDLFGPNPTPEVMEINHRAAELAAEYLSYAVFTFVPTVEQPYVMSYEEYFKQKEKDAE